MDYDSIIFDLDGTLWNALNNSAIGWTNGLKSLGIPGNVTAQELSTVVGKPFGDCINSLFPGLIKKYPELINSIECHERNYIEKHGGELYPNVFHGINRLSNAYQIFIVSNCQNWYLEAFLTHSKTRNCFTASDCHGKSNLSKHKMIKNIVLEQKLRKPVYIGDTLSDYTSSRKAGVDFIFAEYGFGKIEADCKRVKDFNTLIEVLL